MKKIIVKPVEDILLQVSEDEQYVLTFNTKCLLYVQEAIKELTGDDKISKDKYGDILHIILYGGINAKENAIDLEKAKELASLMKPAEGIAIINEFSESLISEMNESQKKTFSAMLKKMGQ